jgi:hypothetical protein
MHAKDLKQCILYCQKQGGNGRLMLEVIWFLTQPGGDYTVVGDCRVVGIDHALKNWLQLLKKNVISDDAGDLLSCGK